MNEEQIAVIFQKNMIKLSDQNIEKSPKKKKRLKKRKSIKSLNQNQTPKLKTKSIDLSAGNNFKEDRIEQKIYMNITPKQEILSIETSRTSNEKRQQFKRMSFKMTTQLVRDKEKYIHKETPKINRSNIPKESPKELSQKLQKYLEKTKGKN